jgi:hypothetical protein
MLTDDSTTGSPHKQASQTLHFGHRGSCATKAELVPEQRADSVTSEGAK